MTCASRVKGLHEALRASFASPQVILLVPTASVVLELRLEQYASQKTGVSRPLNVRDRETSACPT
eukprot:4813029-Amphidinium_carterae.2